MIYSLLKVIYIILWKIIGKIFKKKKPLTYYIAYSNKLIANKNNEKLFDLLSEGVQMYPKSTDMNRKIARLYYRFEELDKAKEHWSVYFKYENNPTAGDMLAYGKILNQMKSYKLAEEKLLIGLEKQPDNDKIKIELSQSYIKQEKWLEAEQMLHFACKDKDKKYHLYYINLSTAYIKQEKYTKAESCLKEGLAAHSASKKLMENSFELAFSMKNWEVAKNLLEKNCNVTNIVTSKAKEYYIRLGISYQLTSEYTKAQAAFDKANMNEENSNWQRKFIKVPLFNNGESKIDFYKKNKNVKKVCITFDSISMTWKNRPFGFKALSEQDIDVVSVSKRTKYSYMQDLSREDFYEALKEVVGIYKDVMCYGFSIGAYSALYYGSVFNSRILSIAPRNSAHPKFGFNQRGNAVFRHELMPDNKHKLKPIIIYDPKNNTDNQYINQGLKVPFPEMIEIKYPYGGHRIATYLLNVGILKQILIRFVNECSFDGIEKLSNDHSYQYLRNLSFECYRRNKIRWSFDLIEKALVLKPDDVKACKLKEKIEAQLEC